ncbi:MAG TPA: IS200/IS605 family transposase [Thermoanaerobaculia bacterium]|nr:IS200/IS605 family transposase [Thermoanaerobaculia bacterium]
MPSTHLSLHYHIVFSTKGRKQSIQPEWIQRLHSFLGGCARELSGIPLAVGGVADHIHLLVGLKATHRLSDLVRDLKRASSEWVHQETGLVRFAWQEGYGAFTVSVSSLVAVRIYIAQQKAHHRKQTFEDEYRALLELHRIEYDKRYLW